MKIRGDPLSTLNMKKIYSFLQITAICLMLTVIIGANGCPQQGATTAGAGGLSAKFVENAPPLNIIVGDKFFIYAEIENSGDAFINEGAAKFYLGGIGQNIQNVKSSLQNKNLLGPGAKERLDFAAEASSNLELVQPLTTTMLLTSCYRYGGKAQADVCIASSNQSTICSIGGAKVTYNSIEPVQISDLKEEVIGNKMQISFIVKNSGKGIAYLPDANCDKLQSKETGEVLKSDQVKIRIGSLGKGFACNLRSLEAPYNSIQALEGSVPLGRVVCEKNLAGEEEQKTALQINLEYTYVETLSQNILISPK
jgi:hypothetical protein